MSELPPSKQNDINEIAGAIEKLGEKLDKLQPEKPPIKKYANTTAIGIFGAAFTTLMFNIRNVTPYADLSLAVMAIAFCLGGVVQFTAGIFELKRGNTFYGTRFVVMSGFWLSLVFLLGAFPGLGGIFGGDNVHSELYPDATIVNRVSMGAYFMIWSVIVAIFFVCAFKQSRVTRLAMGSVSILLFFLSLHFFTGIMAIRVVGGVFGVAGALFGLYAAAGILLNHEFGRKILPLGYNPLKSETDKKTNEEKK
ncbi:MAG: acetate uptake transporter [Firmicutes bacterium]|nr:acetate uptake transporter [Bacillota bacterium]